jgi:hypothetical protein
MTPTTSVLTTRSYSRPRYIAVVMPRNSATGTAIMAVTAPSLSVLASRAPMSSAMGMLLA